MNYDQRLFGLRLWPFFFCLLFCQCCLGNIDSLEQRLTEVATGSERVGVLNELAKTYNGEDFIKAKKYGEEALLMSESINDQVGRREALLRLSYINYYLSQ